ncbi:hypothetical protein [Burkholderia cepacia]|uniref:hypothetical protein n=1 Tax=Burkholderia cepacia TaxID=292 RepID=UPI0012D86B8A|nr:hypothetical protein [Burkholderia cepacia]
MISVQLEPRRIHPDASTNRIDALKRFGYSLSDIEASLDSQLAGASPGRLVLVTV